MYVSPTIISREEWTNILRTTPADDLDDYAEKPMPSDGPTLADPGSEE
jgi:hypothetical protein